MLVFIQARKAELDSSLQSRAALEERGESHRHTGGCILIEVCWGYNQQGLCCSWRAFVGTGGARLLWNAGTTREGSGFGVLLQTGQASVANCHLGLR